MGLDESYVQDAAQAAVGLVYRQGKPCELAYRPGNSTTYWLSIAPFGRSVTSSCCDWMDHPKRASIYDDLGDPESGDDLTWVLLTWVGHGAWPFDLAAFVEPVYIREKLHCLPGDATAIAALLHAMGRAAHLAGPRAVA